jgi:tRNA threonylcarbamoyladenosine biosynthesis protein TsaB
MAFGNHDQASDLIIPMIDARRMEVFTAVYSKQMQLVAPPCNLILDANSYDEQLNHHQVLFIGDGAPKWETVCKHENAKFGTPLHNETHHAALAEQYFKEQYFAALFEVIPNYTKEFHNTQKG